MCCSVIGTHTKIPIPNVRYATPPILSDTYFISITVLSDSHMKIITCNIRCFGGDDGDDHWVHRKDYCARVIRDQQPDLIGFQEMWRQQFDDLLPLFPEYACYALADEALSLHPMNTIFYRRDAFHLISQGGYWLSPTPHVPGSLGWDSACVRQAVWVRLTDKASGGEFRFANTHLDHVGQLAREHQARIVNEDASAYPADYPQLLSGDMNCAAGNPAIDTFLKGGWQDTYTQAHGPDDPGATFHSFQGPDFKSDLGKIDWIFSRGAVRTTSAEIIRDNNQGRYPSDHYFVTTEVELLV